MKKILVILLLYCSCALAQNQTITLTAQVKDKYGGVISFPGIRIMNAKKSIQANQIGVFKATLDRTDTLLIYARDFATFKYVVPDSLKGHEAFITITLYPIEYQLDEVVIYDTKPIYEIKKNILKTQYNNPDVYKYVAPSSPITMLYEMFSKKEKEKRLVATWEYDMEVRNIYKELIKYYITEGIIRDMSEPEMYAFVQYLDVPEYILRKASDYDLAMYVKAKQFEYYKLKDR